MFPWQQFEGLGNNEALSPSSFSRVHRPRFNCHSVHFLCVSAIILTSLEELRGWCCTKKRTSFLPDLGFRPKTVRVVLKSALRRPSCRQDTVYCGMQKYFNKVIISPEMLLMHRPRRRFQSFSGRSDTCTAERGWNTSVLLFGFIPWVFMVPGTCMHTALDASLKKYHHIFTDCYLSSK